MSALLISDTPTAVNACVFVLERRRNPYDAD
jgi:hypothetical protein